MAEKLMSAQLAAGGAASHFCSEKEDGDMQRCRAGGEGNLFLALSSPVASSGHIYSTTFCQVQASRVQTLLC